jgi:hypothetical protein
MRRVQNPQRFQIWKPAARHNSFANFCVNDFCIGVRRFYLHLMRHKRNRMVVLKLNNNKQRPSPNMAAPCFGFFGTFPATQSSLSPPARGL